MRIILLDYAEEAEKLMTMGALATRSKKVSADIEPTEKQIRNMIKWTKKLQLSSVLDFSYYMFAIEGVSRSFTHQWVRYRIAAHMQQSLRYVKISVDKPDWFIVPPTITQKGVDAIITYVKNQLKAGETYLKLLEKGVPPEDARFALPIGVKTHLTSVFNAEEFIHIVKQRTCFDAQWEIRTVANVILIAGLIVHPIIFEGLGPHCIYEGVCKGIGNWTCKEDAEKVTKKVYNIAEEARKKFEKLNVGEFLKLDLTGELGFKAPAEVVEKVKEELNLPIDLDIKVVLEVKKK
ncbi:MAG: FAD-dependent thymidylate synthase [Candidatus Njordarchaeia archaeon]